jgi:hypothetical protein
MAGRKLWWSKDQLVTHIHRIMTLSHIDRHITGKASILDKYGVIAVCHTNPGTTPHTVDDHDIFGVSILILLPMFRTSRTIL